VAWTPWSAVIASALDWDLVVTRMLAGLVPAASKPLRMAFPIEPVPRIAICFDFMV
jgi:hypothetical protein